MTEAGRLLWAHIKDRYADREEQVSAYILIIRHAMDNTGYFFDQTETTVMWDRVDQLLDLRDSMLPAASRRKL